MSIFDLFRTKKTEIVELDLEPFYSFTENIKTDEYRLYDGNLPASATITCLGCCEYCGNESGKSDGRGGCVSCGAPLPKITKKTELSYYYTS